MSFPIKIYPFLWSLSIQFTPTNTAHRLWWTLVTHLSSATYGHHFQHFVVHPSLDVKNHVVTNPLIIIIIHSSNIIFFRVHCCIFWFERLYVKWGRRREGRKGGGKNEMVYTQSTWVTMCSKGKKKNKSNLNQYYGTIVIILKGGCEKAVYTLAVGEITCCHHQGPFPNLACFSFVLV